MFKRNWPMMDANEGDGGDAGGAATTSTPAASAGAPVTQASTEPAPAATTPATTPAEPLAASWDDGWREKVAGTDEKLLKRLERYPSIKAAADAMIEAQNKLRSGELKFAPKEGSNAEQVAAWRKDVGIPEKYSDYDVGVIPPEAKQVAENFMKMAHAENFTPEKVKAGVEFLVAERQRVVEEAFARDDEIAEKAEEELRREWGNDYKPNFNAITNLLAKYGPEGFAADLLSGRKADGTPLGNDPAVLRFLASVAREINPFATVLPGTGINQVEAAQSRMAELESMMGDETSSYNKGSQAASLQAEYLRLTEASLKARRAA